MRSDDAGSPALESYLSRLEVELAGVSEAERRDILLETRSHVVERAQRSPGRAPNEILAELGSPDEYARRFLADAAMPTTAVSATPAITRRPTALFGIARLATSGLRWLPLLCVVLFAYAIAVFAILVGIEKILEPAGTGLFYDYVDGHRRFRGLVVGDAPMPGREVLGYWFVTIMLGIALTIHLLMSALLRWFLRFETRRARNAT